MPFPRSNREAWLPTRLEGAGEAQQYCPNLSRAIRIRLNVTPLLSSRAHNVHTYLQVRIPVRALGVPAIYASNLPTDRYPRLRELREAAQEDGLVLEHESENNPYVLLEYSVGVPLPRPSWIHGLFSFLKNLGKH